MKKINIKQSISFLLCLFVVFVFTSNVGAAIKGFSPNGELSGKVPVSFEQFYSKNISALPPSFGLDFQLTSPEGMDWTINMKMAGNHVVGGNINGNICDPLAWSLTDGIITKNNLFFTGIYTGKLDCADNIFMDTTRSGKLTFSGTYTWNYNSGNPTSYNGVLTLINYIPSSNPDVPLDLEELIIGR